MTKEEFQDWLSWHKRKFPSLGQWLGKLRNLADVLDEWRSTLNGCAIEDLKEASTQLAANTIKRVPYGDHPKEIAGIAKQIKSQRERRAALARFGEGTVACPLCADSGWVSVWFIPGETKRHDEFRKESIIGKLLSGAYKGPLFASALRCDCVAGMTHWSKIARFQNGMYRVTPESSRVEMLRRRGESWQAALEPDDSWQTNPTEF